MNTLRLYRTKSGFRWTLTAKNGRKIANGGEAYERRGDMVRALRIIWPYVLEPGFDDVYKLRIEDETKKAK